MRFAGREGRRSIRRPRRDFIGEAKRPPGADRIKPRGPQGPRAGKIFRRGAERAAAERIEIGLHEKRLSFDRPIGKTGAISTGTPSGKGSRFPRRRPENPPLKAEKRWRTRASALCDTRAATRGETRLKNNFGGVIP